MSSRRIFTCVGTFDFFRIRIAASIASRRMRPSKPCSAIRSSAGSRRTSPSDSAASNRADRHQNTFRRRALLEGIACAARPLVLHELRDAARARRPPRGAALRFVPRRIASRIERHRARVGQLGEAGDRAGFDRSVPACFASGRSEHVECARIARLSQRR